MTQNQCSDGIPEALVIVVYCSIFFILVCDSIVCCSILKSKYIHNYSLVCCSILCIIVYHTIACCSILCML